MMFCSAKDKQDYATVKLIIPTYVVVSAVLTVA